MLPMPSPRTTTTTMTTTMTPLDTLRTLRERSKIGPAHSAARHSPDGYFANDDILLRHWRPSTGPVSSAPANGGMPPFIRRRSKGHLAGLPGAGTDTDMLQDVLEEDGAAGADPAHPWRRPSRHDSRSPCPALNVAANHGYLPRDGRNLSMWSIIRAIRECYNVSWALALVFTIGAFILLRLGGVGRGWLWPRIDLEDLAVHNVLEHNSSLTHADHDEQDAQSPAASPRSRSVSSSSSTAISAAPAEPPRLAFPLSLLPLPSFLKHHLAGRYHAHPPKPTRSKRCTPDSSRPTAPTRPSRTLIRALLADSASGTHFTLTDVARARLRRIAATGPCPAHLSHISDAECALAVAVLGRDVYGDSPSVPLGVLKEWLGEERLPAGWRPGGVMGLWREHQNTARVQELIAKARRYRERRNEVRTVVME